MRRLLIVAVVAVLGVVLLAKQGGWHFGTSTGSAKPPATNSVTTDAAGHKTYHFRLLASSGPSICTMFLSGHDAEVQFSSSSLDVNPACTTWVQSSADGGELWTNTAPAVPAAVASVCTLKLGQATAYVLDTGGEIYGQEACTRLISGGWHES